MQLLVCVLNNTAVVDEIVDRLRAIGSPGATVIDSHGTAMMGSAQVPVFGGFRHLVRGDRSSNRTLFTVVRDDETAERAIAEIESVCGDLDNPSTGIVFSVPVLRATGLIPRPAPEPDD